MAASVSESVSSKEMQVFKATITETFLNKHSY